MLYLYKPSDCDWPFGAASLMTSLATLVSTWLLSLILTPAIINRTSRCVRRALAWRSWRPDGPASPVYYEPDDVSVSLPVSYTHLTLPTNREV